MLEDIGTLSYTLLAQGISGHLNHDGRGGYFKYPYEADVLRAASYKAYGLAVSSYFKRSSNHLNILYLPRDTKSKGRQLLNVNEMEGVVLSMTVVPFLNLNLEF